uniref:Uncharacterized protein n=1 Tax=viral metagenome TaxID=1070528 RepID=A0A6C0LQV5_9ZZZZ
MPSLPSLHLLDYSTANSIEHFIQYYIMFSTFGLLMNLIRFFFYNFVTQDNKDTEIKHLRAEVENLHNVLDEVVRYLNRNKTRENYDEEKAEELWSDDEKAEKPAEEKKDN